MKGRELGKTGLKIFPVSFGGITVSRSTPDETESLVNWAIDHGVNYFDCAHSYADTSKKLGAVLPERRDEVHVGVKVLDRTEDEAYQRLLSSLRDLNIDRADVMWLHAVDLEEVLDQVLGRGGAVHALVRAREEGLTRFLGITGHRPDLLAQALKRFPFDVVMVPLNYLYRFSFAAETGLLPLCSRRHVGVIGIKPRAYQTLPDIRTCLRYALAQGASSVIPHGEPKELKLAVEAAHGVTALSTQEVEALLQGSPELEGVCRQCSYCLPCPEGIDIPFVLKLSDVWRGPHRVKDYNPNYPVQVWARRVYASLTTKADRCTSCGVCESRCPFDVKVVSQLAFAHQRLTEGS